MAAIRDTYGNKIKRNASDEVLVDSGGNSSIELLIDTDLQQPNRIHKDGSNLVSQITDKAQNIAFFLNSGNGSTYDYNGHFDGSTCNNYYKASKKINLNDYSSWAIHGRVGINDISNVSILFGDRNSPITSGFILFQYSTAVPSVQGSINLQWVDTVNGLKTIVLNNPTHANGDVYDFAVEKIGNQLFFYIGGQTVGGNINFYLRSIYTGFNGIVYDANEPLKLFGDNNNQNSNIDLHALHVYDDAILAKKYTTPNVVLFDTPTPLKWLDLTHYKRYANKSADKINLATTRYLENAVIDSNDNVTAIYCEGKSYLDGSVYRQLNLLGEGSILPKWTNKGFYFDGTNNQRFRVRNGTSDQLFTLNNKFFISCWYMPLDNVKQNQFSIDLRIPGGALRLNVSYNHPSNLGDGFLLYDGSNILNSPLNYPVNKYVHIACLMDDLTGLLYLFLNGIVIGTTTPAWDLNNGGVGTTLTLAYGERTNTAGFTPICYMDDFMFSFDNKVLNPATFVSGPKKFEPPSRRSLDSHILQYPNTVIQL